MTQRMRLIRCRACEHVGRVPREVPVVRKVRCTACGHIWAIREVCGDRPVRRRHSPAADIKAKAAQAVLSRYDAIPDGGDSLDDLWAPTPADAVATK